MRPSGASSILLAAGTFGRPGMVMMSPQTTTTNSAPADSRTSRIGMVIAGRRALGVGIGREAVLRLGDADRELAEAFLLELGEAVAHALVGGDVVGAVDLLRDGACLVPQRHVVGIERLELRLASSRSVLHHGLARDPPRPRRHRAQ